MKVLLKTGLLLLLPFLILIVWLTVTDYKPQLNEPVAVYSPMNGGSPKAAEDNLVIFNWNIGYGGLGKDMDFFMDEGTRVRAPEEEYASYREGIFNTVRKTPADIYFFQEVDWKSTRSYKENQVEELAEILKGKSYSFASNYKVKYIPSPRIIGTQYGSVHSGLAIYSEYHIEQARRFALPGNYPWPKKIFFLDRCLLMTVIPAESGREWVLINLHTSAYDKGGFLKKEQLEFIKELALTQYNQGRYVVLGGDWNSYLPDTDENQFKSLEIPPAFYRPLPEGWSMPGWSWALDPGVATNRSLAAPYKEGISFTSVIDGYLVSPNVEIIDVEGIDLGFAHSDHNPIILSVRMKQGVDG